MIGIIWERWLFLVSAIGIMRLQMVRDGVFDPFVISAHNVWTIGHSERIMIVRGCTLHVCGVEEKIAETDGTEKNAII